jgi:hypothetical protein
MSTIPSQIGADENSQPAHQSVCARVVHPSLLELHDFADKIGWRCLSQEWMSAAATYEFECQNRHRLKRGAAIVRGTPICAECEFEAIHMRCLKNVAAHGGAMLSPFKGLQERHRLRCASGHEWETLGIHTRNGRWCPVCAREQSAQAQRRSDGLKRLHAVAAARGGRCLSDTYVNGRERYLFECAKGHRWEATGNAVIRKSWCRRCADAEVGPRSAKALVCRDGLKRLQDAASACGGECLSSEYINQRTAYRFRCAQGHEWMQVASVIWQGSWCARCAHLAQRTPIETLRELAVARGGRCLSQENGGSGVKLTWVCHRGHVWQAKPNDVKSGHWCPNCAILERTKNSLKRKRYDVEG